MFCPPRDALISEPYRSLQIQLHAREGGYGRSGARHACRLIALAEELGCGSILDYGCGDALLERSLREAGWPGEIQNYDPCVAGRESMPAPADLVVCTDVLEHVEPAKLGAVLEHIRTLARKHAYLVICTREAGKILADGRNAHLIVRDAVWWADILRKSGWHFRSCGTNHKEVTFCLDAPGEPQ